MSKASKMRAEVENELWRVREQSKTIDKESRTYELLTAQATILEKVLKDFDEIEQNHKKAKK